MLTVITRRPATVASQSTEPVIPEAEQQKRRVEDTSQEPQAKRKRPIVIEIPSDDDSDSDEETVEEMIIDDAMPGAWKDKKARIYQKVNGSREKRRPKFNEKKRDLSDIVDLSMIDLTIDDPPAQTQSTNSDVFTSHAPSQLTSSEATSASSTFNSTSATSYSSQAQHAEHHPPASHFTKRAAEESDGDDAPTGTYKRARTGSLPPSPDKRRATKDRDEYLRKRQEMKRKKMVRNLGLSNQRREARDRAFLESVRRSAQNVLFNETAGQLDGE